MVLGVLVLWNAWRRFKVFYFCGMGERGIRYSIFVEWVNVV